MMHFLLYFFKVCFVLWARLKQGYKKTVPTGCKTVKLYAPPKLIAQYFCDFEIHINVCRQNLLDIAFLSQIDNFNSHLLIGQELASVKVNYQSLNLIKQLLVGVNLDEPASTHRHDCLLKQIDHNLYEQVLIGMDLFGTTIVQSNRNLNTLSIKIILNSVLNLLHACFEIDLSVVWLVEIIVGYVVYIPIVSNPVAHLFHFKSTIIN